MGKDNRAFHREWLDKFNNRQQGEKGGITAGFEYAIQPDGTCMGERHWQERRQRSSTYSFHSPGSRSQTSTSTSTSSSTLHNPRNLYQTSSLVQLQRDALQSATTYQEASIMPPPPAPKDKSSMQTNHNRATSTPPPAPFLSPTRRRRNPSNAVFGQHLPNALNSPACAAKVFGKQAALREEHQLCETLLTNKENSVNQFVPPDDDDDELFMSLDVDKLVAERQSKMQHSFDYGNEGSKRFSDVSVISMVSNDTAPRQSLALTSNPSNQSAFYDLSGDSSREPTPRNDTSFDSSTNQRSFAGSTLNHSRAGMFGDEGSSVGGFSSTFHTRNNHHNAGSAMNNSFDSWQHNDDSSMNFGKGASNSQYQRERISGASDHSLRFDGNTSGTPHSTFSTAPNESFGSSNDAFHDSAGRRSNPASFNDSSTDQDVPLCPGHSRPCRLLTARSAANTGRQFFKCCMEDECDFFQWADGMEGNWNNDNSAGGSGNTGDGDVLDHRNENRRKFGHSSFRPGQQAVIENALEGRDVFVLMPTGGGKSLCYQLPAWCSPGLSIVISPLLSLIQDQVQSMTKLGVESVFLTSTQDYETEQREIQKRLFATPAHGGVKLLYITPEKLRHSNVIKNVMRTLYDRNLISRFVVDEAHCLR